MKKELKYELIFHGKPSVPTLLEHEQKHFREEAIKYAREIYYIKKIKEVKKT